MRKKMLKNAKFMIVVRCDKREGIIRTIQVLDKRTDEIKPESFIYERGIATFQDLNDMKETLNWNLNGDSRKYQFGWGPTFNHVSEGYAYIFD